MINAVNSTLPELINNLFPTPGSPGVGSGRPTSGLIVGIAVGVLLGVVVIGIGSWVGVRSRKRNRITGESSAQKGVSRPFPKESSTFRALFVDTRFVSRRK